MARSAYPSALHECSGWNGCGGLSASLRLCAIKSSVDEGSRGMRLQNKVAIVTGAASGIGKATAALFRSEGATVIAADRAEAEGVAAADAGSEDNVRALVERAVADHGGLDIFFANAGISGGL